MTPAERSVAQPLRISMVAGHRAEGDWPDRLSQARVDIVRLDQSEAQRSRLRKRSEGGTEIALSLQRGTRLRDGDILHWDESSQAALIAVIDLQDVLAIDLSGLLEEPAEVLMARCVEVGHALGNQHWPAVVNGSTVYVPLAVAADVMAAVMKTHGFEGVTYSFAPGNEVVPCLTPHEARRLFGGPDIHQHAEPAKSGGT